MSKWRKELDIGGAAPLIVAANSAEQGRYPVTLETPSSVLVALTINQALDLAHELTEAVRHSQEVTP